MLMKFNFEKDGTTKDGYQVHAARGCLKLAKEKGWINPKKHNPPNFLGQRYNDNQEGSNYFEQEDHQESNYWVCHARR